MLRTTRHWLWVLAGSLAVACGLNPQPDLPGSSGSPGNNAGGGVVTPSAGSGAIGVGGTAATAGTSSGGTFSDGGGEPSTAAGANAGGDASGGDGGGGGEAGENASGAGHRG